MSVRKEKSTNDDLLSEHSKSKLRDILSIKDEEYETDPIQSEDRVKKRQVKEFYDNKYKEARIWCILLSVSNIVLASKSLL